MNTSRTFFALALAGTLVVGLARSRAAAELRMPDAQAPSPAALGYYRFPAIHGDTIVFTAEGDLWRVGVNGGVAQRPTTHPAEESRPSVSPDGRTIAFSAAYEGPTEVYTQPLDGGVPLTADYKGTSKNPMLWNGRLYFLSDRDGTMNLWSIAERGGDARQHTRHAGFDAAWPSLSNGRITYQLAADLRVFDIGANDERAVSIKLLSDFDPLRERWVRTPMEWVTSAHVSPTGDRVMLTARGQVFVAPAQQGRTVEATRGKKVRNQVLVKVAARDGAPCAT